MLKTRVNMARDSKGKQRADDRADNEQMDMDPSQSQSQSAHRATPRVHGSARRSKSSKGKGRARQDEDGDDGEEDQKMASDDDNNDQEEDGDEEMEESNTAKTNSKTKGPGNAGLDGAYDPKQSGFHVRPNSDASPGGWLTSVVESLPHQMSSRSEKSAETTGI